MIEDHLRDDEFERLIQLQILEYEQGNRVVKKTTFISRGGAKMTVLLSQPGWAGWRLIDRASHSISARCLRKFRRSKPKE